MTAMRYVLKRYKALKTTVASSANTAISQFTDIRTALALGPNEMAVATSMSINIGVDGANADAAKLFWIGITREGLQTQMVIYETIAQATLVNTASVYRFAPSTNHTLGTNDVIALFPGNKLWLHADAGGALCVFTLTLNALWYIFEEEKEQTQTITPSPLPVSIPQRAGWWQ